MALRGPDYQRDWRKALHAILLVMIRRAEAGDLNECYLLDSLRLELRIANEVTRDALDFLVRDEVIGREYRKGLLASQHFYWLNPRALEIFAGAREHKYLKFQVNYGA